MMLDQGIGAHAAQLLYGYFGWFDTWVSGTPLVTGIVKFMLQHDHFSGGIQQRQRH